LARRVSATAEHGLHAQPDATKVIAKAIAARLPPAQKPAGSGMHARALLPGQRYCKKLHRTHTSTKDDASPVA